MTSKILLAGVVGLLSLATPLISGADEASSEIKKLEMVSEHQGWGSESASLTLSKEGYGVVIGSDGKVMT